jgi:cysteine desulfurase/selenocysteine lyase
MDRLGIPGTIRASLAFYNTKEELDYFAKSLRRAISMLL